MTYDTLASSEVVKKTIAALSGRNIHAQFLPNREEALARVREMIPSGASVMTGSSTTLEQIGFVEVLKSGAHSWKNLKDMIVAEKDETRQTHLRKESVGAEYFLGSVHAVAQSGEVVIASASGSQIPSYAFTSDHVIWVAGTQKIVPTLDDCLQRIRDYVFPLEDARMKKAGYPGSTVGKLLIIEKEIMPREITLLLVNEKLGF